MLQFAHGALCDLAEAPGGAPAALGLLLAAATAASQEARSELMAYEFFEQVGACWVQKFRKRSQHSQACPCRSCQDRQHWLNHCLIVAFLHSQIRMVAPVRL